MQSELLYLAQTDTVVGFLSQSQSALENAKDRLPNKRFIKVVASSSGIRVPKLHKNLIRKAKKTTLICKESFRVVRDEPHVSLVERFGWLYSTSANRSGERFCIEFAISRADVVVYGQKEYSFEIPSKILKLSRSRKKRLR